MWNRTSPLAVAATPAIIGEYVVGEELGRGATSIVYRATRNGTAYALKLTQEQATPASGDPLLRFRREAAAIARFNHPSLVRIVDVGEADGRPYIVMDLVEGESLDKRLARGSLNTAETVALAKSFAGALGEIHRFGLVHRDIKPANMVIGTAGAVKLIDFGLVTGSTDADAVVGTLHYAAPEQLGLVKRGVGAPADLYSLGATMFECLTERKPIQGDTQSDFFRHLAVTPAPDVTTLRPDVSPALTAIVSKLLKKDPDDRYQSARGLIADLDALSELDTAIARGEQPVLGAHDVVASGDREVPLCGRQAELKRLLGALDKAATGNITFALVEGEAGSGKSRLVHELMSAADVRGALVLSGRCQELDNVPFGALREAVDWHVSHVLRLVGPEKKPAEDRIRHAAGAYAPLFRRLSSGLQQLLGGSDELRQLEPGAEQQRFFEAIASSLRNLGTAESPLVLVIDDVAWLDPGSLEVFSRLVSGSTKGHVLVVATSRTGGTCAPGLARFIETVEPLSERLLLSALDIESVRQLITARLGGKPLVGRSVEKIAVLTRSNPFAVSEYLRALLDGGLLRPVEGKWIADEKALDAANLPNDVAELMVSRLSSLTPETLRILSVAAVIGGRFSVALLTKVSGAESEAISRALQEMRLAGLVERTDLDTYSFVHDRVRAEAAAKLTEQARRDTHQAIATALDAVANPSPDELYALARHYAQGDTERNAKRASETNLAAGLHALQEHANDEAYELLDRALTLSRQAGTYEPNAMKLLEALGRACAMTGRLQQAFQHLEEALRRATNRKDRFRLQYLLTLTYASQGRNDDALAALMEAFQVLGRPFPRSTIAQIASLVWTWVFALILHWTGIGHGRAEGEEREERRVLAQLHYAGSMIALFQGRPVLMVQFVVRDFLNVHYLGPVSEAAVTYALYGAVLGTASLKSLMEKYTKLGISIAERLGDQAALAVCRAYQAVGTKWAGDLVTGNKILVETALPAINRHVPGSWYQAMMITEQAYSYLHAGHSTAAINHVRAHLGQLDRTNNLMFRYNSRSVMSAELRLTGQTAESTESWKVLEEEFKPLASTIYVGLARCIASLELLVDEEETGHRVDEQIDAFQRLLSEDYYSLAARVLAGYARLNQLRAATGEAQKTAARRRFEQAARSLSIRALAPVFKSHAVIFKAVLARLDGKHDRAAALLTRADKLATRCQSTRAAFYVAVERARLAKDTGDSASSAYAQIAYSIARGELWRQKMRQVVTEFGITPQEERRADATRTTTTMTMAGGIDQGRRYADALLQVSLASASTLDPNELAKNALTEVARVLGAERALFFLVDPKSGELELKAWAGDGAENISHTVVKRVVETRTPAIFSGSDDGEVLGSESIVAYGLRSVMAAPLMLRDRLVGVVYLDSRMAKGMFTNDDVNLLLGVSNHIAIAVETARTAQLENERAALASDMKVLAAVQNLLLPKSRAFEAGKLRGVGFYQPATQCGGDWWWQDALPDGSTLLVLGDVSGHGPGPAMVSSAAASAFHTIRALRADATPPEVLSEVHRCVQRFGGFNMTMSIARVDPQAGTITWWNAAGPEAFILHRDGRVQCLTAPGSVLGDAAPLELGELSAPFGPGDRLLLCTDGVLEMRSGSGRMLGARRISKLLTKFAQTPLEESCAHLGEELNRILDGRPQEDDITFILVEALAAPQGNGKVPLRGRPAEAVS